MSLYKLSWYCRCFFALFLVHNSMAAISNCDQLYHIKGNYTDLVLDGTGPRLTIQKVTNTAEQKWQFLFTNSVGLFNIVNALTGTVLEINLEDCDENPTYPKCYLHLSPLNLSKHEQQWFLNYNGTITNAYTNYNLDIQFANYTAGTHVVGFEPDTYPQQRFTLIRTT